MTTWREAIDNNYTLVIPDGCKLSTKESGVLLGSKKACGNMKYRNFGGRKFICINEEYDYFAIDFKYIDSKIPTFIQIIKPTKE